MPATKNKNNRKPPATRHQPFEVDTSGLESGSLDAASKVHDFADRVNGESSIDEAPGPIDPNRAPILGPRPGGYQPSQVQVAMQRADERRNLAGLLEFLEARRERIHVRSSCPGSVALRSVKSNADAIRWILQNLHRVRIVEEG